MSHWDGWWFQGPIITGPEYTSIEQEIGNVWSPLQVSDTHRLENAYSDYKLNKGTEEVAVHDSNGQLLSKVSVSKMKMEPLYWEGPSRHVRRSLWIKMKSDKDIDGGSPLAPDWDAAIEAAYQENLTWINKETEDGVVEMMATLKQPLNNFVFVLRQGVNTSGKLVLKSVLEESKPFSSSSSRHEIRLIRGYVPYFILHSGAIKTAGVDSSDKSGKYVIPPSPFETPTLQVKVPKSLVLVVHGIGQKFAERKGDTFVKALDTLREKMLQAISLKHGDMEDCLMIPVSWREDLNLPINFQTTDGDRREKNFEVLAKRITLDNIPAVREVFLDVGLDILLYMTPDYFSVIIASALKEIHRIYNIFKGVFGNEACNTHVSMVGHSLGSAIVSDLLSFTLDDPSPESISKGYQSVIENLGFPVDKFFAMGSPLAMFFLLRQIRPLGCYSDNLGRDITIHTEGKDTEMYPSLQQEHDIRPRDLIYACKEIYNIFHPHDPLAYRMEPLFLCPEEMAKYQLPVKIPYYKKGALHLKRQMEARSQAIQNAVKDALPNWIRNRISSPVLDDSSMNSLAIAASSRSAVLKRFNHHGRVDYSLEEGIIESAYIASIKSHLSYWEDIDIAHFIASEVGAFPPEPQNT